MAKLYRDTGGHHCRYCRLSTKDGVGVRRGTIAEHGRFDVRRPPCCGAEVRCARRPVRALWPKQRRMEPVRPRDDETEGLTGDIQPTRRRQQRRR